MYTLNKKKIKKDYGKIETFGIEILDKNKVNTSKFLRKKHSIGTIVEYNLYYVVNEQEELIEELNKKKKELIDYLDK